MYCLDTPQCGEDLVLLPPVMIVCLVQHRKLRNIPYDIGLPDVHQALGVRKRKRAQQHAIDDTEHGAVGTDTQRQSEHSRQSEARILAQGSQCELQVL